MKEEINMRTICIYIGYKPFGWHRIIPTRRQRTHTKKKQRRNNNIGGNKQRCVASKMLTHIHTQMPPRLNHDDEPMDSRSNEKKISYYWNRLVLKCVIYSIHKSPESHQYCNIIAAMENGSFLNTYNRRYNLTVITDQTEGRSRQRVCGVRKFSDSDQLGWRFRSKGNGEIKGDQENEETHNINNNNSDSSRTWLIKPQIVSTAHGMRNPPRNRAKIEIKRGQMIHYYTHAPDRRNCRKWTLFLMIAAIILFVYVYFMVAVAHFHKYLFIIYYIDLWWYLAVVFSSVRRFWLCVAIIRCGCNDKFLWLPDDGGP